MAENENDTTTPSSEDTVTDDELHATEAERAIVVRLNSLVCNVALLGT